MNLSRSLLNIWINKLNYSKSLNNGTLKGLRMGVKDVFWTEELPTTAASKMLKDFHKKEDATCVRLAKNNGAILTGKTNCDEFGMGSSNRNSEFGPVLHPLSKPGPDARLAGGSSGGSAAAVALNECDFALSTDTGGSTRLPASYCGIVGLKPSYGLISRYGLIPYAESLDCVGIMAKNTAMVNKVFDVISQYDIKDPTSESKEIRQQINEGAEKIRLSNNTWKIGLPEELFFTVPSKALDSLMSKLQSNTLSDGKRVEFYTVSLPSSLSSLKAYYILASAEASSSMARYDGMQYGYRSENKTISETRTEGFGPEVQRRILLGTFVLSAKAFDNYYLAAQRTRSLIQQDFNNIFKIPNVKYEEFNTSKPGVDFIIHPTALLSPPKLHVEENASDNYAQDMLTTPASLAGIPSLNLPIGKDNEGWPLGISITGQWGDEQGIFNIAKEIENFIE